MYAQNARRDVADEARTIESSDVPVSGIDFCSVSHSWQRKINSTPTGTSISGQFRFI
jgi:hypothetical protein